MDRCMASNSCNKRRQLTLRMITQSKYIQTEAEAKAISSNWVFLFLEDQSSSRKMTTSVLQTAINRSKVSWGTASVNTFWWSRKLENPEIILEVGWPCTETRLTCTDDKVGGVIVDHYASQGVHQGLFPDGHPSNFQSHHTGLKFGEQIAISVSFWC